MGWVASRKIELKAQENANGTKINERNAIGHSQSHAEKSRGIYKKKKKETKEKKRKEKRVKQYTGNERKTKQFEIN